MHTQEVEEVEEREQRGKSILRLREERGIMKFDICRHHVGAEGGAGAAPRKHQTRRNQLSQKGDARTGTTSSQFGTTTIHAQQHTRIHR